MVDVRNVECKHEGCRTRPDYNYQGKTKSLYCPVPKEDRMVDVKHKSINKKNVERNLFIITEE